MAATHLFQRGTLFQSKIWFAAFYGSMGCLMPYFNMLLAHMGYEARQIGIVSVCRPLVSAVSGTLLSSLADGLSAHRKVFLFTLALSMMARCSLGVLATPFAYLVCLIFVMEIVNGPVTALSDTAVLAVSKQHGDYGTCRFWACVAHNIAGMASSLAMGIVGDSAAFVGYGAGAGLAFSAAWYLDFDKVDARGHAEAAAPTPSQQACFSMPQEPPSDASSALAVHVAIDCGDAQDAWEPLLPPEPPSVAVLRDWEDRGGDAVPGYTSGGDEAPHTPLLMPPKPVTFLQKLFKALRNPHMMLFLSKGLVMGVCVGVIDGYLFVYLDQLGAPSVLMGTCLIMIGCAELPIFAYAGQILTFLGYSGALHLALGAFCCRLAVYSLLHLMPSYWIVVPFEMLHGITFGLAWAAGVNYCQVMAPEGLKSTIQSLFGASYYGLGRGVGGLCGGLLMHTFGGPVMFGSVLVWTACWWGVISVAEMLVVYFGTSSQHA